MTIRYRLTREPDDNGTILLTSPDLPVVTFGVDDDEAIRHSADAIDTLLASMISNREPVPVPAHTDERGLSHAVSLQTELKIRLHNALLAEGLTRADLQRRLGWQRESVDRLFRLNHQSRVDQMELAFAALGKNVGVDIRDAA